jgi:hypothetical protein
MLEGKEVSGKVGEYGEYSVDVSAQGKVEAILVLKVDILAEVKKLAEKSKTPLDDQAIAWLEKLLAVVG